jgi:hypothetical protein
MSSGALYNICIAQGTTFSNTFVLRHKVILSSAAAIGDTTLNIPPIAFPLSTGDTLTFGTTVVTLTADAEVGDRTLTIEPLSAALPSGATAKGSLIDLTGVQARAAIRDDYNAAAPLAAFSCSISGSEITISMSSVVTAAIPANIQPGKADDLSELQSIAFPTVADSKLFNPGRSPYFWDLEVYNSASPPVVTRYLYGKLLVTSEATK